MALDPFDGNFTSQSLQAQLDAVRTTQMASAASDISLRMRDIQAAASLESQMRIQRVQADMLRMMQQANIQQVSQQSALGQAMYGSLVSMPGAHLGTNFFGGRNVGYTATGAMTQSFGGLLSDAGLARMLHGATGGMFFPGYSMAFGATRRQVEETAREELAQRLGDFPRGVAATLTPDFIRSRLGFRFLEQEGDVRRRFASSLAGIRSGAGEAERADGTGIRLRSRLVGDMTDTTMRLIENWNAERGYSISDKEAKDLGGIFTDTVAFDTQMQRRIMQGGKSTMTSEFRALKDSMDLLQRTLGLNTEALKQSNLDRLKQGVGLKQLNAQTRAIGMTAFNSLMSQDQLRDALDQLRIEGRSMDYGIGDDYSQRQMWAAFGLRDRLLNQGARGMAELGRFGGANNDEKALLYQQNRQQGNERWMQRYGPSFGLAAASGMDMSAGIGAISQRVGQLYGQDPLSYVEMMRDPSKRLEGTMNADVSAYMVAQSLAKGMARKAEDVPKFGVLGLSRIYGVSLPRAAEMWEGFEWEKGEAGLRELANKVGVTPEQLIALRRSYESNNIQWDPQRILDDINSQRIDAGQLKKVVNGSKGIGDLLSVLDSTTLEDKGKKLNQMNMGEIGDETSWNRLTKEQYVDRIAGWERTGRVSAQFLERAQNSNITTLPPQYRGGLSATIPGIRYNDLLSEMEQSAADPTQLGLRIRDIAGGKASLEKELYETVAKLSSGTPGQPGYSSDELRYGAVQTGAIDENERRRIGVALELVRSRVAAQTPRTSISIDAIDKNVLEQLAKAMKTEVM